MKKSASSNTLQFSDKPTELDHMIEDFVILLDSLAVGIADIASESLELRDLSNDPQEHLASVSSRLVSVSSEYESIKSRIILVQNQFDKVQNNIFAGILMKHNDFEDSRDSINNSSTFIEQHLNRAVNRIRDGSPYEEAFDQMMLVAIEYVELVKKFNEAVVSYNKLHSTNLTGAKADLLIKKEKGPWKSTEEFDDYISALYAEIAMDHFEKEHFAEADAMSDEDFLKKWNARRAKFGLPPTTMEEYLS